MISASERRSGVGMTVRPLGGEYGGATMVVYCKAPEAILLVHKSAREGIILEFQNKMEHTEQLWLEALQ